MDLIANNYKKGDPFPPRADKSVLRVYSLQVCPYAERVLLTLAAKGIKHEIINVNVLDKPEWLLERNPMGKVPTIEFDLDDKILFESLIVSEYLDEVFVGRKLQSNDPYIRAKDREFIERVSPYLSAYVKAIWSKEDKAIIWTGIKESLKKGEELLTKRKTQKFLSGDSEPGYLDYMIWPFIERVPIAIDIISDDIKGEEYLRKELPTLYGLRNEMLSDTTVKKVCVNYNDLLNYYLEKRKMLLTNSK